MPGKTEPSIILDTHSWIWLLEGADSIGSSEFVTEAEAASVAGRLYVCAISIAEVALLARSGRLRLVVPVSTWLREALETPGLQVIDIDVDIAAEAAALPELFQGDAADRMIVAAARLTGGQLATADPVLAAYGREGHVRILPLPAASLGG